MPFICVYLLCVSIYIPWPFPPVWGVADNIIMEILYIIAFALLWMILFFGEVLILLYDEVVIENLEYE